MPTAAFVAEVIRENYPTLNVPLHARWRHFVFAGRDLWAGHRRPNDTGRMRPRRRVRSSISRSSRCCSMPAPGPDWRYRDRRDRHAASGARKGSRLQACACSRRGFFRPIRAIRCAPTPRTLARASPPRISRDGFQVARDNPLTGLEGRAALIARLGQTLLDRPDGVCDRRSRAAGRAVRSSAQRGGRERCLRRKSCASVLHHLGPIWPGAHLRSAASRSATPGGIRRSSAAMRPTACAVPQAVAMADLFADRAAAGRRRRRSPISTGSPGLRNIAMAACSSMPA